MAPRSIAHLPSSAAGAAAQPRGIRELMDAFQDIQVHLQQVHVVPEHGANLVRHARSKVAAPSRLVPTPTPAVLAARLWGIHGSMNALPTEASAERSRVMPWIIGPVPVRHVRRRSIAASRLLVTLLLSSAAVRLKEIHETTHVGQAPPVQLPEASHVFVVLNPKVPVLQV